MTDGRPDINVIAGWSGFVSVHENGVRMHVEAESEFELH
jgi:hypothetical protein